MTQGRLSSSTAEACGCTPQARNLQTESRETRYKPPALSGDRGMPSTARHGVPARPEPQDTAKAGHYAYTAHPAMSRQDWRVPLCLLYALR